MGPLNILILSACPRDWSAGLADDMIIALESAGHQVDFNYPEFEEDKLMASRLAIPSIFFRILNKLRIIRLFNKLGIVFKFQNRQIIIGKGQRMFYNMDERTPLIDPSILLNRLKDKKYDVIITLFWTNVFNSTTLRILYDNFHCPIFIYAVDMAPMTGGCYYISNCDQYAKECSNCPVWSGVLGNRANDNFKIKKYNYDSIKVSLAANTWGGRFAKKTHLFKHISIGSIIINDQIFYPKKKEDSFFFNIIPGGKKFIMLARYTGNEIRKGYNYLIESIKYFLSQISDDEKKEVLLLLIGKEEDNATKLIDIDTIHLGFLDITKLVDAYSVSNVFLCPSINDGGPSMVNQSIMCGTPVVSFDSGTAIDVIYNGRSGFKVPLKDTKAFGDAIRQLFLMSDVEFDALRVTTREVALQWNSPLAFVKQVENVYNLFNH